MPTRMNRPASGAWTLNAVASAMANTVPGTAHGSASRASIAPPARTAPAHRQDRRRPARSPRPPRWPTVASQRLLSSGRARTGSWIRVR